MKNQGAMKLPKAIRVCAPILQNKANASALTADKNNQSGTSEGEIHAAAAMASFTSPRPKPAIFLNI